MPPSAEHGYVLMCDRLGCAALLTASAPYDGLAVRRTTALAVAQGWQLVVIDGTALDFCPDHHVGEDIASPAATRAGRHP